MNCPNCNAEIDGSTKFCPSCGNPITTLEPTTTMPQAQAAPQQVSTASAVTVKAAPKKKSKLPVLLASILVLVGLGVFALFNPGHILPWDPILGSQPTQQEPEQNAPVSDETESSTGDEQTESTGAPEDQSAGSQEEASTQTHSQPSNSDAGEYSYLLGTWNMVLQGSKDGIKCYGAEEQVPSITITSVNETSGRVSADVSLLVHHHAPASGPVSTDPGDDYALDEGAALSIEIGADYPQEMSYYHVVEYEDESYVEIELTFELPDPNDPTDQITVHEEQTVHKLGGPNSTRIETWKSDFVLERS